MTAPTLHKVLPAGSYEYAVRVELPPDPRFLRIARLAASGLADEAGFDIDDVENLRIAVDEAGGALIEVADADGCIELQFRLGPGSVEFEGSVAASVPPTLHPLAQSVLEVLTRDLVLAHGDGKATIAFRLGAEQPGRPGAGA